MALRELTNLEIDEYYQNNPYYGGCFSKDDIYTLGGGKNKFFILNMDKPSSSGSHWVVLYMCSSVGIYFDSFALDPPQKVLKYMKKYKKNNIRNIGAIQDLQSSSCGWFCIYTIDKLLKGDSFVDTMDKFNTRSPKANEKVLLAYFYMK